MSLLPISTETVSECVGSNGQSVTHCSTISRITDHVSKLCSKDRHTRPLYKTIDGAVVTSDMDDGINCEMTFQTESVMQRFMIRFEVLALDCNDHLYIYDGDIVGGKAKVSSWEDIDCLNSSRTVYRLTCHVGVRDQRSERFTHRATS